MDKGILNYFSKSGLLPIVFIMAAIMFIAIITICIIAYFDKKEDKRERFFKSLMILVIAGFLVLSSISISNLIYSGIKNQTISGTNTSKSETSKIDPIERDRSWGEKIVYEFFDGLAADFVWLNDVCIGETVGLRDTLLRTANNTIIDFDVVYEGEKINLYNLILTTTSFLLFFMIICTAYKLIKFSYNKQMREDVINSFQKWFYVIILMMLVPYIFVALLKIMEFLMKEFGKINSEYMFSTDSMTVENFGALASVAKIYGAYLEFKIYVLMMYRKFIVNVYFVTLPVVVYEYGISDNFESFHTWINILLINIFSPLSYTITFIVATLLLKSIPNGENAMIMLIVLSLALKIADELRNIVKLKTGGKALGNSSEVNSITKAVVKTALALKTVSKILTNKGVSNTSTNTASSSDVVNSNASNNQNQYVNTRNGLKSNYSSMEKVKESVNMLGKSKKAKVIAGIATGIATGNPLIGYAAYKSSGVIFDSLCGIGKVAGSAYKQFDKAVDKIEDCFKKYSTDNKAHRRD